LKRGVRRQPEATGTSAIIHPVSSIIEACFFPIQVQFASNCGAKIESKQANGINKVDGKIKNALLFGRRNLRDTPLLIKSRKHNFLLMGKV